MKNALYFQASRGTKLTLNTLRDGTIAQLVEQRTFNPFVVGSTPAGPTKIFFNLAQVQEHQSQSEQIGFFVSWCYSSV